MSQQGRLSGAVKCSECVPKVRLVLRQPFLPAFVPRVDSFGGYAFLQTGSLGGKGQCEKSDLRATPRGSEPVKGRQHEVVQHCLECDGGVFRQRIPQSQRAMC